MVLGLGMNMNECRSQSMSDEIKIVQSYEGITSLHSRTVPPVRQVSDCGETASMKWRHLAGGPRSNAHCGYHEHRSGQRGRK